MTRADYSQLAGAVAYGAVDDVNLIGAGTGGNPDLKPSRRTTSTQLRVLLRPRAWSRPALFYMDLTSYIGLASGAQDAHYIDNAHPTAVRWTST